MPLKRFGTVTSGESWKRGRELLQEKKIEIVQPENIQPPLLCQRSLG
ncbi:CWC15 spliceosome associated protein-like protein [Rhinolophus ferrumequinum]|uniref:CWC15 spliceosome associated protein-like protein n=1 Tax=Rhinolophus ferrumequinum TaxID=59479 RepID=A0A7J7W6C7_RHIFE|nr:CWC15 spliceosome associated protein-like protein [Rhinolophus ferrumequinum]